MAKRFLILTVALLGACSRFDAPAQRDAAPATVSTATASATSPAIPAELRAGLDSHHRSRPPQPHQSARVR